MFAVLHGECTLSEAVGEGKYTQRNDHILSHNSGLCSRAQGVRKSQYMVLFACAVYTRVKHIALN